MMKINSASRLIPTSTATFQSEDKTTDTNKQTSAGANVQPAELHGLQIISINTTNTQIHTQIFNVVLLNIEEPSMEND